MILMVFFTLDLISIVSFKLKKDMGPLKYFLGIEFVQSSFGIAFPKRSML